MAINTNHVTNDISASSGNVTIDGKTIPETAKQEQWDQAYGWGNHASAGYALSSSLATVATSGSYGDLIDTPTLGTAASKDVPSAGDATSTQVVLGNDTRLTDARTPTTHTHTAAQVTGLATVATSGSYDDLTGKPTLGTAAAANTGDFATAAQGAKADTALQPAAIGVTVQGYSAVLNGTTASFTTALKDKLDGIATGATANQTDAYLLDRANHTGTQPASSITGLTKASVGLDNVDNTSDANKPLSSAAISALETKVDKQAGMGLSQENYTLDDKNIVSSVPLLADRVDELHNYHNVSRIFGPTDAGGMWDASLLAPGEATTLPNIMGGSASRLTSVGNVGSAVTVMGAQVLRSVTGSAYESTEPILPPNSPFTFAASFQVPDDSRAALFYQQQAGADGRLQLWANGELNASGTGIYHAPGKLKLFVGGAPEQLEAADITPNVPFDLILTMNGAGEGKLYVNGRLISTRQNMPSVVDTPSSIFGNTLAPGNGLLFGRAFVIDRVASEEELRAIRLWVSQGFASNFTTKRPFKEPDITAVSAYSMVLPAYGGRVVSGEGILFSKDPDTPIPPASITKVLSCVTVSKIATKLGLGANSYFRNTIATVQSSDITSGSGNNLLSGDAISLYDLMANTLIPSSNTSATVLARTFGSALLESEGQSSPSPAQAVARFVAEMNSVAISLGMDGSTFVNPHGLHDASQFTTARDLALLGVEAMYHASIAELWGQSAYTLSVTRGGVSTPIGIVSSNAMADDFDILGGKTGNLTGITSNFLVVSRAPGGNIVCTVVMGSANSAARFTDARAVIDSVNSGYAWPQTQPSLCV